MRTLCVCVCVHFREFKSSHKKGKKPNIHQDSLYMIQISPKHQILHYSIMSIRRRSVGSEPGFGLNRLRWKRVTESAVGKQRTTKKTTTALNHNPDGSWHFFLRLGGWFIWWPCKGHNRGQSWWLSRASFKFRNTCVAAVLCGRSQVHAIMTSPTSSRRNLRC